MTVSALPIRENAFRDAVVAYARLRGWLTYFTWRSVHSPAGFPDLVMVRDGRIVVAELKVGKNTPTPAQWEWLRAFAEVGDVTARIWYPDSWDEIEKELA